MDAGATLYLAAYQAGYPAFLADIAQHLGLQLHKLLPAVREARRAAALPPDEHARLAAALQTAHLLAAAHRCAVTADIVEVPVPPWCRLGSWSARAYLTAACGAARRAGRRRGLHTCLHAVHV